MFSYSWFEYCYVIFSHVGVSEIAIDMHLTFKMGALERGGGGGEFLDMLFLSETQNLGENEICKLLWRSHWLSCHFENVCGCMYLLLCLIHVCVRVFTCMHKLGWTRSSQIPETENTSFKEHKHQQWDIVLNLSVVETKNQKRALRVWICWCQKIQILHRFEILLSVPSSHL